MKVLAVIGVKGERDCHSSTLQTGCQALSYNRFSFVLMTHQKDFGALMMFLSI
jgi:hypothetical protein